ncbi:complex I 24 kDa subunit family protein [Halarsenatibacter silvermanii]|uniref:NADH-quinone oxidoreductase subunit E n=1 Tax=Halarsenatibacter silvermanii TaxID=321763 RepID=A0A1G9IYZ4_9FIRM|nr:NAD(P)H-dependent oxidoreductase subunit E [Halarsenatibacter silvermanii]SDL30430.1 NADH-quinone oxidoreductase subunit E [Halarsenatibacter silvermanii]
MSANEEINWHRVEPELEEIVKRNDAQQEALIEIMHETQSLIGHIPERAQERIARGLEISPSRVKSVISFYTYFTDQPRGQFEVSICKGTACYVKGAEEIIDRISEEYEIAPGETTEDGLVSLEVVRCLGACGLAPVMTVNGNAHGMLNPEKAVSIIDRYCKKAELEEV